MATNTIMYPIENDVNDVNDVFTLHEEVDLNAFRIIRDNFNVVYDKLGSFSEFNADKQEWEQVDYKKANTIINEMYRLKTESSIVKYSYGKKLKSGRRFAPHSLQSLCRPLRHTIAKDISYDIDMKNAHPTFLLDLTKKLQFSHPILEKYIQNRDVLLDEWIGTTNIYKQVPSKKVPGEKVFELVVLQTKDDVKKYFLAVLNGGGSNKTTCAELNEYYDTHNEFLTQFYKHPDYKNYKYRADNKYKTKKDTDKDNKKGTALNYYLCDVENNALRVIEKYLISKGIQYGTLCFDGLMVYKRDVPDVATLITELETVLVEEMNFPILLAEKKMDEGIDLTGLSIIPDVRLTEQDYAKYLLDSLLPIIKYNKYMDELYVYDVKDALWKLQKISHLRLFLTDILDKYIEKHPDEKERLKALDDIRSNRMQLNIISMMTPYLHQQDDSKFINENFDCILGLLPIANKQVIDFKTHTVKERVKEHYFTKTTLNKIIPMNDKDRAIAMKYYYEWLNTNDLSYVECFIKTIGIIFSGETSLKAIFNYIGPKDSGKSSFLTMMRDMLGEFACTASERVFINQKNKAVHDSELFNLLGKRLASLSETKKTQSYNTTLMKAISGNDPINIRGAGEKKSVDVLFRSLLALATNEPCKHDDPAFAGRLWCFHFSNKFEPNNTFMPELKSRYDLMFSLIAEYAHYEEGIEKHIKKHEKVVDFTQQLNDKQCTVITWCKSQLYVKTDNNKDYLENAVIYNKYKNDCMENNEEGKVYGKIDFYKRFETYYELEQEVLIKTKERSFRAYRYLKEIDEE